MKSHWKNREWKYRDAETTRKPGYLAARFRQIKAEQAEAEREKSEKVRQIKERK